MEMQTSFQSKEYEQRLLGIVHKLPSERVSQVIDFAQFLAYRDTKIHDETILDEGKSEEEIAAENARWDALLSTDKSQRLLEEMADEALADIQAGRVRPMLFTEDGEIAPG